MRSTEHNARGFSLVELLVAVALGLIVLAATTQLFKNGMDATILVTQSSEMQQNVRATLNLIAKDVSMAGSGLPYRRSGSAQRRRIDSLRSSRWILTRPGWPTMSYPVHNFMFGIIPGAGQRYGIGRAGQRRGHGTRHRTRSRSFTPTMLSR